MIYAIVAVLVLIADQAVKFWTTKTIVLGAVGEECVSLIPGFIHATNVHNYGAAFGILQDARWPLALVSAAFVVVIIVLINKEIIHTRYGKWLAVLIVAGALGNCIDRVLYGYVVDMFEFEFSVFGKAFSFPVFNVSDIFITVCGILFCLHVIFHNEPEAVKAANEPEFMRRMREEKQEKQEMQAQLDSVPKRGEHVPLSEELRADAGADAFAEWDLGGLDAAAVDDTDTETAAASAATPAQPAAETPRRGVVTDISEAFSTGIADDLFDDTEYSLEDILNEFRDMEL